MIDSNDRGDLTVSRNGRHAPCSAASADGILHRFRGCFARRRLLSGCGRRAERDAALSFEDLSDTTGLARGAPLLTAFEPYRLRGGAMRVRGSATECSPTAHRSTSLASGSASSS